jgi:hypothetical protein
MADNTKAFKALLCMVNAGIADWRRIDVGVALMRHDVVLAVGECGHRDHDFLREKAGRSKPSCQGIERRAAALRLSTIFVANETARVTADGVESERALARRWPRESDFQVFEGCARVVDQLSLDADSWPVRGTGARDAPAGEERHRANSFPSRRHARHDVSPDV